MKYEVYHDAASGLHFAVICEDGKCSYFYSSVDEEDLREMIAAAKAGEDLSRWNNGEEDPQASYASMLSYVEAKDSNVHVVTDEYCGDKC